VGSVQIVIGQSSRESPLNSKSAGDPYAGIRQAANPQQFSAGTAKAEEPFEDIARKLRGEQRAQHGCPLY
jgi:hypothetical protein